MFAYGLNNPIKMADQEGEAAANIIGGAASAAVGVLRAKQLGLKGWKKWALIAASTAGGAALGAFLGLKIAKVAKKAGQKLKSIKQAVKKKSVSMCFVAGTLVSSEAGLVPIENIKEGDLVWAENPETGEQTLKRVVQTFENQTEELVHVFVGGEKITATPGHPFYVPVKGWVEAISLRAGDILVLQNGEYVTVEKIQHEILETPVIVYNFEVEDFHTYFVGKLLVLVHNKFGMNSKRILNETKIKGYKISLDIKRGGAGLVNIHLKIGNTKYYYEAGKFIDSVGREIPRALRDNALIKAALKRALDIKEKGW